MTVNSNMEISLWENITVNKVFKKTDFLWENVNSFANEIFYIIKRK